MDRQADSRILPKIFAMPIMEELILDMTENIVGNEENAGNQDFLPFLQCFQKALLFKGH